MIPNSKMNLHQLLFEFEPQVVAHFNDRLAPHNFGAEIVPLAERRLFCSLEKVLRLQADRLVGAECEAAVE